MTATNLDHTCLEKLQNFMSKARRDCRETGASLSFPQVALLLHHAAAEQARNVDVVWDLVVDIKTTLGGRFSSEATAAKRARPETTRASSPQPKSGIRVPESSTFQNVDAVMCELRKIDLSRDCVSKSAIAERALCARLCYTRVFMGDGGKVVEPILEPLEEHKQVSLRFDEDNTSIDGAESMDGRGDNQGDGGSGSGSSDDNAMRQAPISDTGLSLSPSNLTTSTPVKPPLPHGPDESGFFEAMTSAVECASPVPQQGSDQTESVPKALKGQKKSSGGKKRRKRPGVKKRVVPKKKPAKKRIISLPDCWVGPSSGPSRRCEQDVPVSDVMSSHQQAFTPIPVPACASSSTGGFDVRKRCKSVLERFKSHRRRELNFHDVVRGRSSSEVAKYFLATLFLLNRSVLELTSTETENFKIKLV